MSSAITLLQKLWRNEDENLPFNPNVNEAEVLKHVIEIVNTDTMTINLKTQIIQWIHFNRWCNAFESNQYKHTLSGIYSEILEKLANN